MDRCIIKNFKTTQPFYAKFWDKQKNKISADKVDHKSRKKYWFKCEQGHEFEISPYDISRGLWCPNCECVDYEKNFVVMANNIFSTAFDNIADPKDYEIIYSYGGEEFKAYPDLVIKDINLCIQFQAEHHRKFIPEIHGTKAKFFKEMQKDVAIKKSMEYNGIRYQLVKLSYNLNDDVKYIQGIMNAILQK